MPEEINHFSKSKSNPGEAQIILAFADYLVSKNYKPSQISILSLYSGQLFELKRQIKNFPSLSTRTKGVVIQTLDNYQGEENDIVLLSLVRNNKNDSIGFLKLFNRVCVSMSRAKQGFYIFGNSKNLRNHSNKKKHIQTENNKKDNFWNKILDILEKSNQIVNHFSLKCTVHRNTIRTKTKEDIFNFKNYGCGELCGLNLKCGHPCKKVCHPIEDVSLISQGYHLGKCFQR